MITTSAIYKTNPRLSGNIKLSVSSSDEIFLNTIDSSTELGYSKYKKYKINPNSSLALDIFRFGSSIPKQTLFESGVSYNNDYPQISFDKQYDTLYKTGVERSDSKLYDESLSFFAPIWISDRIPKYFVVFCTPKAKSLYYEKNPKLVSGVKYRVISDNSTFYILYDNVKYYNNDIITAKQDNSEYILLNNNGYLIMDDQEYEYSISSSPSNIKQNLFDESKILKVFDLSEKSNIGKYLKKHIYDVSFNKESLFIDLENKRITYFGIDINTGCQTSASEDISDLLTKEYTITEFDDFITAGFERNGILSSNLINLEFLFDDVVSDEYTFNRYFGFYCDDVDISSFSLGFVQMFVNNYKDPWYKSNKIPFKYTNVIENKTGVSLFPDIDSYSCFKPSQINANNLNSIFYIKDINKNIHKIKSVSDDKITISDDKINTFDLYGINDNHIELNAKKTTKIGKGCFHIEINQKPSVGDKIILHRNNKKISEVVCDDLMNLNESEFKLVKTYYTGNGHSYSAGDSLGYYFNPNGDIEDVALALSRAFNYITKGMGMDAISFGSNVVVYKKDNKPCDVYSIEIQSESIICYNTKMIGHTSTSKCRVVVDKDLSADITTNSFVRIKDGYCKIKNISPYTDEPVFDENNEIASFKDISKYVVISIENENSEIDVSEGVCFIHNYNRLTYGALHFYPVLQFDDCIKTVSYNNTIFDEYNKYFNKQSGTLIENRNYLLKNVGNSLNQIKNGNQIITAFQYTISNITENTVTVTENIKDEIVTGYCILRVDENTKHDIYEFNKLSNNTFEIVNIDNKQYKYISSIFIATSSEYSVISGSVQVVDLLFYDDEEIKKFGGFGGINVQNDSFLTYNQNEYEYMSEQESSFLYKLRKNKTINKWVGDYGVNDDDYRLNLSLAFGSTNFTPSHIDESNSKVFTHEWFYLGGLPNEISNGALLNNERYFDTPFDENKILSETEDYFTKYFSVDSYYINNSIIRINNQKRYSIIKKDIYGSFYTFFKGYKLSFSNNIDLTDYKFSIVLNIKQSSQTEIPISYTVYQNNKYNNITIVINVVSDDYKTTNDSLSFEYLYLYVMNSLVKLENGNKVYGNKYEYPDITPADIYIDINGTLTKQTEFRAFKLYNKTDMDNLKTYGAIKFDDSYIDLSFSYTLNENGSYGRLIGISQDGSMVVTCQNPVGNTEEELIINRESTIQKIENSTVYLNDNGLSIFKISRVGGVGSFEPILINSGVYKLSNFVWYIENGGLGVYKALNESISFHSIVNKLNNNLITRKSNDGKSNNISIITPIKLEIQSTIQKNKVNVNIGSNTYKDYVYDYNNIKTSIYRYGGYFSPKVVDIISFVDMVVNETFGSMNTSWQNQNTSWQNQTYNNRQISINKSRFFKDKNINIDTNSGFFILDEKYNKVDKIDAISGKDFSYPTYNSSVDLKNMSILINETDNKYHVEHISNNNFVYKSGTISLIDKKNYITKLVKLPTSIISTSTNFILDTNILSNDYSMNGNLFVYEITDNEILFRISHDNIIKKDINDKLNDEFYKVHSIKNIDNKETNPIESYTKNNLLKPFNLGSLSVYVKKTPKNIEFVEYNKLSLIKNGYIELKNIDIQQNINNDIMFRFKKDMGSGYSIAIKIELIS